MTELPVIPGYRILARAGQGGMATVFRAVQERLDRQVAIKVLGRIGSHHEAEERRFEREAKILARIVHPNVCAVYDFGRVDQVVYIALEWLDGGTLADRLERGLDIGDALAILLQLARGLEVAHQAGIIHRDLKPPNVMMRGETPVLTDFGIARDLGSTISTSGLVIGTPAYMSPEQLQGQAVDARTDIYSLGAMLHELLTGRQPYGGATFHELAMQHIVAPLPRLPESLRELQPMLDRMLAKDPADRYANCAELVEHLRGLVQQSTGLQAQMAQGANGSWSQRLRSLGISAESEPVRPAPVARRGEQRPPAAVAAPVGKRRAPDRRRIGFGIGGLLLVLLGVWALWPRGLDPALESALRALSEQMEAGLGSEELYAGPASPARKLQDMRSIRADAEVTRAAEQRFLDALGQRIDQRLQSGEVDAAEDLVDAGRALFDEARLAPLAARIAGHRRNLEQTAQRQRLEAQIRARLAVLDPVVLRSLTATLGEWRRVGGGNEDPLIGEVISAVRGPVELALGSGDLGRAGQWLEALGEVLPGHPQTVALNRDFRTAEAAMRERELLQALATRAEQATLDLSDIDAYVADSRELAKFSSVEAPSRSRFIERVEAMAAQSARSGDPARVLALSRALEGWQSSAVLDRLAGEAQARLTAEAEQAEQQAIAARRGRLIVDAAPWGRIVSVIDLASGREVPLPTERVTPMRLELEGGRYRVRVRDGLGADERTLEARVEPQRPTRLLARFDSFSAEDYRRAAGL